MKQHSKSGFELTSGLEGQNPRKTVPGNGVGCVDGWVARAGWVGGWVGVPSFNRMDNHEGGLAGPLECPQATVLSL